MRPIIFSVCFLVTSVVWAGKKGLVEESSLTLLNSKGRSESPKDLQLDTSWIGLVVLSGEGNEVMCTAIHAKAETLTLHSACLPGKSPFSKLTLYFWNKSGSQTKRILAKEILTIRSQDSITLIKIPKEISDQWQTSGSEPRKNELWFGGFHPQWELVRVYSFEEGSDKKHFHFQVNTCKASLRSPLLKRIRPKSVERDEEVLAETELIAKGMAGESYPILEKCLHPFSKSSQGGLITLAKDFSQKFGFLVKLQVEALSQRELAEIKSKPQSQERTELRYIGADGLETELPQNLASVELILSVGFEKLFR